MKDFEIAEGLAKNPHWTIKHLYEHLQYAADLELWTIPYYMSAMYSIVDRSSDAFQLIQSVVNQEMMHLQCVANVANAYGYSPQIRTPVYKGTTIPHLNFNLDKPDPIKHFSPYSAEIGPLDLKRINTMCLIEFPEWDSISKPVLRENVKEYANIGDFYRAVEYGAELLQHHIKGGINQVNYFAAFYRNLPVMTITDNGAAGFYQVALLINVISDQGEGAKHHQQLKKAFQNTADDKFMEEDHFDKFMRIKHGKDGLPTTYDEASQADYTRYHRQLQHIVADNFEALRHNLEALFVGKNPDDFVKCMISVGAAIQNCWKNGVTPTFI